MNATVHHLNYSKSDHRPISMSLDEDLVQENNGSALLGFESRWLKEKKRSGDSATSVGVF